MVPILLPLLAAGLLQATAPEPGAADLILHGGRVWTLDPSRPEARAVAVRGNHIVRVGTDAEVLALRGAGTHTEDLGGRLLLPGFTDAHTHFENACDWLFRVALYETRSTADIVERLRPALARVPRGMWIQGGDFGAEVAWRAAARGESPPAPWVPDLAVLDAEAPDHPVVLRRVDGAYFANTRALERARFTPDTPDPRGGRIEKDTAGRLTGMLYGRAGERMVELMPPPSLASKLVGARAALADLARAGITSIHDVARLDEVSRRHVFHTHVERSSTDLGVFRELQRRGELSVRVYALLGLHVWKDLLEAGIRPRSDEGLIRYGGLKAFVDGFLMDEPYLDNPRYSGAFTFRFVDEAAIAQDIAGADRAGFDPAIHTVGDKAHRLLLDWYEAAVAQNPPRDRRFRVVHAWYPSAREIARMGRLGLIADITPNHLVRGLRSIDRSLGPERSRTAHAWRSLMDAGLRLNVVSDWPGSYNEQEATPLSPLENIALAVSRQAPDGTPPGGWHPAQRLTVAEAVAAYTANPAFASYEEDRKGAIREGHLADLVVLSRDIRGLEADAIRGTSVDLTVLGGRVIYRRER
ncbi:MAG TPA: amidohydrolase [Vicinamibacteria bacterium]|nr:amidohydrolase [Vicinamibacteria bacterium]